MKKKTNKASLGNVARAAGISTAAASFAIQNKPGVSPVTRKRVLRIAKRLGYAPNAQLSNLMAEMRETKSKDLLPIAWLNTGWEKDSWRRYLFHTPYIEGASARALELGYKLEDFWAHEPGMTMQRLTKILYQRGIEGVIVTHPARHLRLEWDHLASVTLGASLLAPRLHRVMADLNYNLLLALKSLRRLKYQRIGICLTQEIDSASHHSIRATARDLYYNAPIKERIPPLFHSAFTYYTMKDNERELKEAEVIKWLKRYNPQVIVGHDSRLKEWAETAGYRVPEDIGVVLLAVDDDVLDWAGINSRRRETGATAIEWLISLMRNHQRGVPKAPLNILMRGSWQTGNTLGPPPELKSRK